MANARTAWGIDVGNRALKAVKLVREGGRLHIDDYEVIEHEQVLSNAGDNRDSLIQTALANFVQRHQTKGIPIAIGVSGQSSFARFIKLPPVEPKKIPEIVRFEAIQQIPFPLDDVEWSYQLFQSPDSPDVEVGIFAMRKDLIGQHIRHFTDVDLNVQVVQMDPLAVYNAMYYDQQLKNTTMIIDLGAENTDLVIADAETVWLRSIPIGGNNFTEALVKSFKLSFQKAEELKRNAATSKYARQIFQAMRPVFADLVAEIQRSIGFYASVHRDSRIRRILALGGTFRLPGLQKYLQQNLQLEVHRLSKLDAGSPQGGAAAAGFAENMLSMVGAYGLAIQAMGESQINSSLLPQSIRRAKKWQEKTKWFGAAAALFVLGAAVAYGSVYYTRSQAQSGPITEKRTQIARVLDQAGDLSRKWSAIENAGASDRQQIMNIASMLKYRPLWIQILTDINNALPTPQPQVLSNDPNVIKSIPRGQRTQIVIDSISSQYMPDMTAVLKGAPSPSAAPSNGRDRNRSPQRYNPSAQNDQNNINANTPRGFVLTIQGTTPYVAQGTSASFVQKQFIDKLTQTLKKGSPEALKRGYYVDDAQITIFQTIGSNPTKINDLKQAYDALISSRSTGAGRATARGDVAFTPPGSVRSSPTANSLPQPSPDAPYLDRLTHEDIRQDSVFTITCNIVVDPSPSLSSQP